MTARSGALASPDSFPSSQEALVIPRERGGFAWQCGSGSSGFPPRPWKPELPVPGSQSGGWEHAAATLQPVLGQPGWREWLGSAACLLGAIWLLSVGLPGAVPGCALLLGGLHYGCRRDELLLDTASRRYLRRRGYLGYRQQWSVSASDFNLILRERLNDLNEPLYELELAVEGQPQITMSLGLYADRDSALAARDRQAERLGMICKQLLD